MRERAILVCFILLVTIAMVAGCTGPGSTTPATPSPARPTAYVPVLVTPAPGSIPPGVSMPKYKTGDIVWKSNATFNNERNADIAGIIFSVDSANKKYTSDIIFRDPGKAGWYRLFPNESVNSISIIEYNYPVRIGTVDPDDIGLKYPSDEDFDIHY